MSVIVVSLVNQINIIINKVKTFFNIEKEKEVWPSRKQKKLENWEIKKRQARKKNKVFRNPIFLQQNKPDKF